MYLRYTKPHYKRWSVTIWSIDRPQQLVHMWHLYALVVCTIHTSYLLMGSDEIWKWQLVNLHQIQYLSGITLTPKTLILTSWICESTLLHTMPSKSTKKWQSRVYMNIEGVICLRLATWQMKDHRQQLTSYYTSSANFGFLLEEARRWLRSSYCTGRN